MVSSTEIKEVREPTLNGDSQDHVRVEPNQVRDISAVLGITHTRYPPELTIKFPFSMMKDRLYSRSAVADSIAAFLE